MLIFGYEWFSRRSDVPDRREIEPAARLATKGELHELLEHLIAALDAVNFFRTVDRRAQHEPCSAADLRPRRAARKPDVHLLRGVIKELARGGRRPPRRGG